MKTRNVWLSFCLLLATCQFALSANSNYYIEIKKQEIEIGAFTDGNYKKKSLLSFSKDQLDLIDQAARLLHTDERENVLFYFHAMWGGTKLAHKNSLKKLNQLDGIDRIVSVIWHTEKFSYKSSWDEAIEQGQEIHELIELLMSDANNKNYVLCHSMGHRLFEGVIKDMNPAQVRFEAVFFAAADLDVDVFSGNLSPLPAICDQIVVYVNEKDRLLQLSRTAHKRDRLGLNAIDYLARFKRYDNIELVNITHSKNGKTLSATNHNYFKSHKGVMRDIGFVITGNEKERKVFFQIEAEAYVELR